MNWQEKVEVYPGADAGAPTIGTLAAAGAQLRTNTDVAWTNQPLRVFANNDVIQSVVSPFGGLFKVNSQASLDLWGTYANSDVIVALSRADVAGEPDSQLIQLAATSDGWAFAGEVFFDANAASTGAAGNYNSQINLLSYNDTIDTQVLNRTSTAEGAWIDVLGFKAQTNPHNFRIRDEDGVVTLFSPFVADGASAVAYTFDTSNALANSNAKITSLRNNGTEVAYILGNGCIAVGKNVDFAWNPGNNDVFAAWHDVSQSEDQSSVVFAGSGATDSLTTSAAYLDFETSAVSTTPRVDFDLVVRSAGQADTSLKIDLTTAPLAVVSMTVADEVGFVLQPSVADGAITVYRLNTFNNLTNASALILSCQNQATHAFDVFANGSIKTGVPSGGTAGQWKLGIKVDATTTFDTTKYLQVDIAGTLYKVGLVTS